MIVLTNALQLNPSLRSLFWVITQEEFHFNGLPVESLSSPLFLDRIQGTKPSEISSCSPAG